MLNNHIPNRLQLLPPLFLLLQQLPPSTHIASMQLGQHILPIRLDRFPRHDVAPHGGLDDDLEELSINVLLELGDPFAARAVHLARVHQSRHRIHRRFVDQELEFDDAPGPPARVFVV